MTPVFVAIVVDSGEPLRIMQFVRGPMPAGGENVLPFGAYWDTTNPGCWLRDATPVLIQMEVQRACPEFGWDETGQPHRLPRVLSWTVIDQEAVPKDTTYRDAWALEGTSIVHDMAKARAIHVARVQEEITTKLWVLDRQLDTKPGRTDPQIEKKVQDLRAAFDTVPTLAAGATTVEELKSARPAALD
jgi:hypothetical protein